MQTLSHLLYFTARNLKIGCVVERTQGLRPVSDCILLNFILLMCVFSSETVMAALELVKYLTQRFRTRFLSALASGCRNAARPAQGGAGDCGTSPCCDGVHS